jgi:ribosomal protein S18 acetylase RimI-like enzyme
MLPTSIEIEPGRTLAIRSFAQADQTAVVDLWKRSGLIRPWNDPEKDIERKLAVQPELFLIATLDKLLIGTVMAGYDGHRGWVNYLAVDPKERRSGIARHLMATVEVLLERRGCPKLNLQMRNDNELAGAFYEAMGYREDRTRSFGKRLIPD